MLNLSRLYVRVDADRRIGVGHFMRCLALAEAWREAGDDVTFVGSYPKTLSDRLAERGIDAAGADLEIPPSVPVVIDGYEFDAETRRALAGSDRRLLVIDDQGDLPAYPGALLLNQNPGAERIAYRDAPVTRLLGPRYALVRAEFRDRTDKPREILPSARTLLLTMGGSDPAGHTARFVELLSRPEFAEQTVRVLIGPANPAREELVRLCREAGPRVEPLADVAEMAGLLEQADLAIAAAGSVCWELACTGLPAAVLATAENQVAVAAGMAAAGAAVDLAPAGGTAPTSEAISQTIVELCRDPARRRRMRDAGRRLIDGRGAERVVAALRGEPEP